MQNAKVTSAAQKRLDRAKKLVDRALAEHRLIRVLRPCAEVNIAGYTNGLDNFVHLQAPTTAIDDHTMRSMGYRKCSLVLIV